VLQILVFEASPLPLDLEALPPPVRNVLLGLQAQVFAKSAQSAAKDAWIQELEHLTKRQEYLIAELRHALYGKKSEKLDGDQRQLIFEDLEVAVAETEAASDQQCSASITMSGRASIRMSACG
jgi:transposase